MARRYTFEELKELKYTDLRKIAKEIGVKGNLKANELSGAIVKESEKTSLGLPSKKSQWETSSTPNNDQEIMDGSSSRGQRLTKNRACLVKLEEAKRLSAEFEPILKKRKRNRSSTGTNMDESVSKVESQKVDNEISFSFKTPSAKSAQSPDVNSTFVVSDEEELNYTKENTLESTGRKNRSVRFASPTFIQSPVLRSSKSKTPTPRPTLVVKPSIKSTRQQSLTKTSSAVKLTVPVPSTAAEILVLTAAPVLKTSGIPRPTRHPGTTPDFKKIHQKVFSKMDSLDVYAAKKKKRAEELSAPRPQKPELRQKIPAAVSLGEKFKKITPAQFKPSVFDVKSANFNFAPLDSKSGFVFEAKRVLVSKENGGPKERVKAVESSKRYLTKTKYGQHAKLPKGLQPKEPYRPSIFTAKNVNVNFMNKEKPEAEKIGPKRILRPNNKDSYNDQKINTKHIAMGQKLRTINPTAIAEKQKSVLKGVRLNKRFELQMKFRNNGPAGGKTHFLP